MIGDESPTKKNSKIVYYDEKKKYNKKNFRVNNQPLIEK